MSEANRLRKVQLNFRVTEREKELIEARMQEIGTTNREAYLRKIAIDGILVKLEVPELKEIVSLMRRTSNNINQIARRLNETGRIYEVDIADVQNLINDIIIADHIPIPLRRHMVKKIYDILLLHFTSPVFLFTISQLYSSCKKKPPGGGFFLIPFI